MTDAANSAEPRARRRGVGDNVLDASKLTAFIERIERLEEEKVSLAEDIKEVKSEVKAAGMDVKTVEKLIKLRKTDRAQRELETEMLEAYMHAMGML